MKNCRECGHQVSEHAFHCPGCGAPYPARPHWDGWGYEYKSKSIVFGLPLLHIALKYRPNGRPVVAKGVFAVGQFAAGVFTVSQFGIGLFSLSQFTIAGFAIAQFGLAWALVAQIGVFVERGFGQVVFSLSEILARLF